MLRFSEWILSVVRFASGVLYLLGCTVFIDCVTELILDCILFLRNSCEHLESVSYRGHKSLSEHRDDGRASSSVDGTRSQTSSAGTGSIQWEILNFFCGGSIWGVYESRECRAVPGMDDWSNFQICRCLRHEPHLLLGRYAYAGCSTSVTWRADAVG